MDDPDAGAPIWRRYQRFIRPDIDADVDEELRFHLEMRARELEARGASPPEARRAALERFGNVERIGGTLRSHDRRRHRAHRRSELMHALAQDLRYGWRSFRRTPGFTLVAALTLALGIGATTAIFSVVRAVILRPLPYPDAERITMVWMDNRRMGLREDIHSWANLEDYRNQNRVFTAIAGYYSTGLNLTGGCAETECEPQRVRAGAATADLFTVMRVRPLTGRPFTVAEEQPGSDAVVVISHGLWQRQFGGSESAIGRTVRLNGRERTVIGVMPPDFTFPEARTDVWIPLALDPDDRQNRQAFGFYAVGRLRDGVSLDRARAEMSTLASALETQYPSNRDYGVYLVPLPEQVVGPTLRTSLWVMLGAVGAVLLIACANVANLMLSRAAARDREIGVRIALGSGRSRLVRQLLTESMLLALVGGALGLLVAWLGLRALVTLAPEDLPRIGEVRLDAVVLVVTALVTLFTGIAFGLAPALDAWRSNLAVVLREGGRSGAGGARGERTRRILAGAQVALVVILLTGAGLLIRSFGALQSVDLGFRPEGLLTMRIALPSAKYEQPAKRVEFWEALLARAAAIPGVQGVGGIQDIFLSPTPNSTSFTIEGRAPTPEDANIELPLDAVTPDYFRVMGIPLRSGRTFTARDNQDAEEVVMINESMARRFWPGEEAVGKRFKYGPADGGGPWMTVVGVVGDMRRTGFDAPVRFETFRPITQRVAGNLTLVARTAGDPASLTSAMRAAVKAVDPEQPVHEVATMDQLLSSRVAQRRFSMALLGSFAALALILGIVGVYGVTSYLVSQRTREVGVRLALGAPPGGVVRMMVGQGMRVAAAGVAVGVAGAFVVTRAMGSLLYGVGAFDVPTLGAVVLLIGLATLMANWLPARRAAGVDPVAALRAE